MGVKFLSLHMIPWCFQLMGNHMSCLQLRSDPEPEPAVAGTVKLIKSDGVVKTYHRPIPVSELMTEFPKHLVCRSDSFYIGQKVPALSEHDRLQIGQKYFLLPNHFFQTVLSFVTVASFAASASQLPAANRKAFLKKAATCQPFDIQKTPSGCLKIRVSDEFIAQLMEEGRGGEAEEEEQSGNKSRVCTTAKLQKDYTQLVGLRQWKPKLETIRETEKKKRKFGASFRRKKSQQIKGTQKAHSHSHNQRSSSSSSHELQQQQLHVTKSSSKSKAKTKTKSRK